MGSVFLRYTTAPSIVRCSGWEPCFWERAWGGRGVYRVVMSFVLPVAADIGECPVVCVHRRFCEQEDVRFVEVKDSD